MELLGNLLGLSNFQGTPQVPPEVSNELERFNYWDRLQKKNKSWSDDARRIVRGEPRPQIMPNFLNAPNPNQHAPLLTEEGWPVFFPIGQWSDRNIELAAEQKNKGKRRMPWGE